MNKFFLTSDENEFGYGQDRRKTFGERLFNWFFCVQNEKSRPERAQSEYADEVSIQSEDFLRAQESLSKRRGVQKALKQWKEATAYFESVSEPELVDYAVYEMEAAQKRYVYLLRGAKESESRA